MKSDCPEMDTITKEGPGYRRREWIPHQPHQADSAFFGANPCQPKTFLMVTSYVSVWPMVPDGENC